MLGGVLGSNGMCWKTRRESITRCYASAAYSLGLACLFSDIRDNNAYPRYPTLG
jgi:hypothetical protein